MAVAAESQPSLPAQRIEPPHRHTDFDLGALWEYRQLLYFFAWRDIKVRYKQTFLGAAWAILQPLLTTIVFTIFFGRVAGLSSNGQPYALFAFVALLAWTFFSNGLTTAANSLVAGASMITKVYFPRLSLPIAAVLGAAVDFCCAATLLVPLMAYYGVPPSLRVLTLPFFFCLAAVAALGTGFGLAALNVRYRDVRYVVPFMMQLWLFATPVVYSSSSLGEPWQTLFAINPMVGVVEGFRWSLLGAGAAPSPGLSTLVSTGAAAIMMLAGLLYFRRTEDSFADVI